MFHHLLLITLVITTTVSCVEEYNILCVFPIPSRSHNTLGKGIVDALLKDGHKVTWITPYPDKKTVKNLKIIDISHVQSQVKDINMMEEDNRHSGPNFVKNMSRNIILDMMKTPAVLQMLTKEKFDAVITEWFFNDVHAGIAAIMKCPWILLNGMVMHPNLEYLVDAVNSPAVVPNMMSEFQVPMNFVERVKNTFFAGIMMAMNTFSDLPASEALYTELFEPLAKKRQVALRPFQEALHDISVVFLNSHPAIAHAQSVPPNVIDVAGYHLDEDTPPLPQDLQTLLDNSPHGVVYFSMGSVLQSTNFPKKTREQLLKIFSKLPHTVLWKFEEPLEGLPKNVHVRAWFSQQSVLAHPKVKLFITHGGMLSSIEAIHFGVPLLAVPMFGDQPSNAMRALRRGYALRVPYTPDMAEEFEHTLNKMIKDDTYYLTAKKLSKLFRTRTVSPKELIAHYTRLAIESEGAPHLRSKALLYPWYQRLLLDQLLVASVILYLVVNFLKSLWKLVFSKKPVSNNNLNKKKRK